MRRWQVGDVRITKVFESEFPARVEQVFPEGQQTQLEAVDWLAPHYVDARGRLRISIHAFVVETPSRCIVVDTCVGNAKTGRDLPFWNDLHTSFMADFAAAGFAPERVDVVLCTHLHADHVGWNTQLVEGKWLPTFPNARYLIGARELDYWRSQIDDAEAIAVQTDSIDPLFAAGLVDLIEPPHQVCPELTLVSTRGHTPGHVSVQIRSQGQEALVTGDIMHHPCQFAHPEWAFRSDAEPERATRTRAELLGRCADTEVLVLGSHFVDPSGGRVVSAGAGRYRFNP
jgi:glyoxylase-like metal-dependent hydrolase (beta-lactamase superfamily II)